MKTILFAGHQNKADLKALASKIYEDGLVTYVGIHDPNKPGGAEAEKWSIARITESQAVEPIETTIEWASGICLFDLIWDNREDYDYELAKF